MNSSESKDKLLNYISKNEDVFRNCRIYLSVDYSAIGLKLKYILDYLKGLNCKVALCREYNSFEYMILRCNFFGVSKERIYKDMLNEITIERCSTKLLEKLTIDQHYRYDKSNLSKCYLEDCCCMNRDTLCDRGLHGDKIDAMLKNTDFEFFIKIREEQFKC